MRTYEEKLAYGRKYYQENKEHLRARSKEWREANPERHRQNIIEWRKNNRDRQLSLYRRWHKKHYVSKTYGVTPDWYEETLQAQGGTCAICHQPPTKRRLVVDHDHGTTEVRGLLCDPCNTALNRLENVDYWYDHASAYLRKFKK